MLGGDVGYTQCLGIIGYCLIPLVVTGLVVPLVSGYHYVALSIKVRLSLFSACLRIIEPFADARRTVGSILGRHIAMCGGTASQEAVDMVPGISTVHSLPLTLHGRVRD